MIGRRKAIGLGAATFLLAQAEGIQACTIAGRSPLLRRGQQTRRTTVVEKLLKSVVDEDWSAMGVAFGDGPWEMNGKRVEQPTSAAQYPKLVAIAFPGIGFSRIKQTVALGDRVFAFVEGDPDEDSDCGQLIDQHYLAFGFSGFSDSIYSVDVV